ncbi:MAG: DUF3887 domain-containing protein, partial [Mycobacterium sp.]
MNTAPTRKELISVARGIPVVAVGTAVAATVLALTACESGSHGGKAEASTTTSSVATSTSAAGASTNPTQGRDNQLALQMLDAIVQCDFDTATAHFDSQMQQKLPRQALASAWTEYQQYLGSYQSHGDPQDVPRSDLTAVNIPLQMAQMPGQF